MLCRRRNPLVNQSLTPLVGHWKLVLVALGAIAGSTDTIGFLALDGLFTAHITGNCVVLAVHFVSHGQTHIAALLAMPVFMAAVLLTRFLAAGLRAGEIHCLRWLLLLEGALLAGFLAVRLRNGPFPDPNAAIAILAGMLGVAAMAVQNSLPDIALTGAPSTAVMTTNVTRLTGEIGGILTARNAVDRAKAASAVNHLWPPIVGFVAGCGLGATCEAAFSSRSLALPLALNVLVLAMTFAPKRGAQAAPR